MIDPDIRDALEEKTQKILNKGNWEQQQKLLQELYSQYLEDYQITNKLVDIRIPTGTKRYHVEVRQIACGKIKDSDNKVCIIAGIRKGDYSPLFGRVEWVDVKEVG